MSKTRRPAVAGLFYPVEADILRQDIHQYLDQARDKLLTVSPRAIIVPHAGYAYSGEVAAAAYKQLMSVSTQINRVVLLGPSHRVAFAGLAVPESDIFNTPLGDIPVDNNAVTKLLAMPQVIASERAHRDEHSLEVQLPFLQEILGDFSLLPLVVGEAERFDVAEIINLFIDDDNTLIVISTDLSHYHAYEEANKIDRATSDAIVHIQPERIGYGDACGRNGLNGMLTVAQQKQLTVELLDLRNSGDMSGSTERVVGYGAYVIH